MRFVASSWHLIHLLKIAANCTEKAMQAALRGIELSPCQAQVLDLIESHGTSMSGISKALCCHKSNVTQIVDALVLMEYVEREVSLEDRRVHRITLTAKGKEVLAVIREALRAKSTHCFSALSTHEQAELERLLARFSESWNEHD